MAGFDDRLTKIENDLQSLHRWFTAFMFLCGANVIILFYKMFIG